MKRCVRQLVVVVMCQLMAAGTTLAALGNPTFSSNNYSVIESQMGASGDFDAQSSSYRFDPGVDDGGSTLGDTTGGGGNSASTSYQTNGGFSTTAQPGLSMIVDTGSVSFGNVSVGTKTTATATFSVKNYTSYGYVVQVIGSPPTNSGHALTALATDTAYNATVEQFGINLVLNSVSGVGADPVQVPSSTFSYGVAGDGSTGTYGTTRPYTVSDKWRFNSGETVASGPRSSGQTDYTVTFMMNAIQTTPGGKYTGSFDLVATGTY